MMKPVSGKYYKLLDIQSFQCHEGSIIERLGSTELKKKGTYGAKFIVTYELQI